jgi:ferredoxin-type protein NapH
MKTITKGLGLPIAVTLFTLALFVIIQIVPDKPMLAAERFLKGGGWIEISVLTIYAWVITRALSDEKKAPKWRKLIWTVFCIVFFSQFFLGLAVDSRFLMTGKLHLPLPFMILGGPVYRAEISFMTILFLSTVLLSGPAWCSYFCYFGALDNAASVGKTDRKPLKNKWVWKYSLLALVIFFALIFRLLGFSGLQTLIPAITLGVIGILIMVLYSRKKKKMVHCVAFCPIGTIVSLVKVVSPFRMSIESSCTNCMRCIPSCKYDALNRENITNRKPGLTCTLCGDCVQSCEVSAIRYHFLGLSKISSRNAFLFITISLYILCLGMGRL